VRNGKCSVILNYPNPSLFSKRNPDKKGDKFIMMYPGSLNFHQGVDIAVKAFALIRDQIPKAEFHIYGGGESKNYIEKLISELSLEERVLMKEVLPHWKIAESMATSDLGIVPKRNDFFGGEAFSTKILEFMSIGIPVIVSGTTIDRYYFNESIVKYFRPGDEKDLAQSMLLMFRDSKERKRLAENASKFVVEFSWDKKKHEYLNLVDRLVNG
jgi:glycosyltransferase involved in cell wall biosynthesis